MPPRLLPVCLAATTLLVAAPAWAGGAEDEARKLFEEGIAAENSGHASEACTKFRQSLGLVREVGPLLKVKDCAVREGKLVAAEASLRELVERWPTPGPELEALKRNLTEIAARIPRLTLGARAGAPAGMSVRLDGAPVPLPATEVSVDPGEHEIIVEVPGRALERMKVTLADAEKKSVELPQIAAVEGPKPPPPEPSSGIGGLGIAGIVVAAIGVGGFIGAGVTGKLVLDKQDEFDAGHCGTEDALPDAPGCGTIASAGDTLLITNGVLWGVGIAGVAVGATLLIVDLVSTPSEPNATKASLGVRPGYAELTVRF